MSDCADTSLAKAAPMLGAALLLPALLLIPHSVTADAAPDVLDVRILIDVSGSMRQNDPDRLRFPALRLLTGQLPDGARAGVWTFGRYVNMVAPYGVVDDAWRDRAAAALRDIPSAAQYTNIEGALETATWNWRAPAEGTQRHLMLFTDGQVELPGGAAENALSRTRITDSIAQRLGVAGVRLHVIALSDATDDALYRQLAARTGGRFEKANQSADLERIFQGIFEQIVGSGRLPLREDAAKPDGQADRDADSPAMTMPVRVPTVASSDIEVPQTPATADPEAAAQTLMPTADYPNRTTVIGLLVLIINLLLLAATGYAWRRWIAPPPLAKAAAAASAASAETPAEAPTPAVTATEPSGLVGNTGRRDLPEALAAIDAAATTGPTPVPLSVPGIAAAPIDEEIDPEGINVDEIELDFDDVALKRGAG